MDPTLASIMVRIGADASQFTAGMRGVVGTAQSTAATVQGLGNRVEGFAAQVGGAVSAMTAGWVGGQTFGVLQTSFGLFAEGEATLLRLGAAVRAAGEPVDATVGAYRQFADQMARLTTQGATATLGQLQMAESFGVSGAAAERAVKNTIAAQAAGLPASIRQMVALEEGNTRMLLRVLPGLRNIKGETERATYAQAQLGKMFAVAEAQAASAGGQVAQLGNAFKNLQRSIGSVVADAAKPIVGMLKDAVAGLTALPKSFKEAAVVGAATAAALVAAVGTVGTAIAVAGLAFNLSFGGAGLLVGAVVAGIAAASVGAARFVSAFGGVGAVAKAAREQIMGALGPVEQIVNNLGPTAATMAADFQRWGGALAGAIAPAVKWLTDAATWVLNLAYANRGLILTVAGVYGTFRLVQAGVAATVLLMQVLHADQLLSAAAWVAWSVAVGVARAAVVLWQGSLLVAKGVLWAVQTGMEVVTAIVTGVWSAGFLAAAAAEGIAALATAGLTAAVAALDVALAPATILAVVVALVPLAVGFVAVAAAVQGTVAAAAALYDLLVTIPTATGPVAAVVGLFGEWGGMVQDVVKAAGKDLPKAWELAKAGFAVAAAEVRDLWPPLWQFITDGFGAAWTLVSDTFTRAVEGMVKTSSLQFAKLLDPTFHMDRATGEWHGVLADQFQKDIDRINENVAADLQTYQLHAQDRLRQLAGQFKVETSPATEAAREEFRKLKEQIDKLPDPQSKWKDWLKSLTDGLGKLPKVDSKAPPASWKDDIAAAKRELEGFHGAIVGTVEDIALLSAYRTVLGGAGHPAVAVAAPPAVNGLGGEDFGTDFVAMSPSPSGGGRAGDAIPLLKQIRDATAATARRPAIEVQGGMGLA